MENWKSINDLYEVFGSVCVHLWISEDTFNGGPLSGSKTED